MGLTESNHSKAATTGCTGPSKSRSTPHFPDSRGYQNRPRQAATLPARPTPENSQTPPYHHPRTPVHDPQPIGHDPRPPEAERCYRDSFVQVGQSPSFRPVAPRRSASADSRKRRSDPLLDAKSLKQLPEIASLRYERAQASLPHGKVSPPTSPRSNPQRQRPTAIYIADDQPARMVRTREGRSRDRAAYRSKSHNTQKSETRDRSRGSGERRQRTTHVSTFTMTPHCPENAPVPATSDYQPVSHHRSKKTHQRSCQRAEYSAPDNPQGDPYICLHYGGTIKNGQKKPVQQVTAWRTEHQEEEPPSPNRQMSQVVIHMNQVTATTLDNYDALNANIESVQVRRNVWFQASRAIGSASEPPMMRKISSKAMRTPSIYETTSGYDGSELIRYPDVTNKVSSLYMRPEMRIADVSRSRGEQEVVFNNAESPSVSRSNNHIAVGTCDHCHALNQSAKEKSVASAYQVSYSKRPDVKDSAFADQLGQENRVNELKWEYFKESEKSIMSDASVSDVREEKNELLPYETILPPLEFCEPSMVQSTANGDASHSFVVSDEEQGLDRDNHISEKKMELNFGINNHVEDFTIIEDGSTVGQFYGCRDSDLENEESPSFAACSSLLSGDGHLSSLTNQDMPVECGDMVDNISLLIDKADREPATDEVNQFVENSLYSLRDSQVLTDSPVVPENKSNEGSDRYLSKTLNERDLDDFYKEQLSLISEYLSLKGPPVFSGKEDKDNSYGSGVVNRPGRPYPADTVPGSPSASAFSQKCLTQSSSLPRHLQCASRSAAADSGHLDNMKAFRNRFRSFDLGHFPVLRLPLGNQPRLVDVLRANSSSPRSSQGEESNAPLTETNNENESNTSDVIASHHTDVVNDTDTNPDAVRNPQVSYPDFCTPPPPQQDGREDDAEGSEAAAAAARALPLTSPSSQNSCGYDRMRTQSCPEARQLPNDGDSPEDEEEEECPFDEGCDVGTIVRGAIPDVTEGECVSLSDGSLSLSGNPPSLRPLLGGGGRGGVPRSLSVDYEGTGVRREGNEVTHNTWQGDTTRRGWGSNRWSTNTGGMSPDGGVTLRHPQKAQPFFPSGEKRRTLSECPPPPQQWPSSSGGVPGNAAVPDLVPPFNRHVRRKPVNRRSLRSIDWDTPLPTVPLDASEDCNFTCHEQCQDLVTLDCKTDLTPDSHTSEEDLYVDTDPGTLIRHESISITVTSQEDEVEELEEDGQEEQEEKHEEEQQEKELLEEPCKKNEEISTLRKSVNRLQSHLVDNETLEAWVEKYNATSQGLQIAKENDGSYRGCIRVHLNLSRPINIVAGTRPPSIYDILQEDRTMEKTLTSFYMPRDAVKAIHITSKTTTREVIIALLRKFKVVDNPQKFALYERTYDIGQAGKAKLRRLGDSECPLVLAINWSAEKLTNKRLVLQENDTADIQWEAFSLPELSNFLRILDREEEEYRCQIKDKYALLRRRIDNILIQSSAE